MRTRQPQGCHAVQGLCRPCARCGGAVRPPVRAHGVYTPLRMCTGRQRRRTAPPWPQNGAAEPARRAHSGCKTGCSATPMAVGGDAAVHDAVKVPQPCGGRNRDVKGAAQVARNGAHGGGRGGFEISQGARRGRLQAPAHLCQTCWLEGSEVCGTTERFGVVRTRPQRHTAGNGRPNARPAQPQSNRGAVAATRRHCGPRGTTHTPELAVTQLSAVVAPPSRRKTSGNAVQTAGGRHATATYVFGKVCF